MFEGSAPDGAFTEVPDCNLPTEVPDCDLPTAITACELSELLFCSTLQPSQVIDMETVAAALAQSLRTNAGQLRTCAAELAASYGKDPDTTCSRMRWARALIAETYRKAS
jgi:hypothetical protein